MSLNWTRYFKKLGSALAMMVLASMLFTGSVVGTAGAFEFGQTPAARTQILSGPENVIRDQERNADRRGHVSGRDESGLPIVDLQDLPREAHVTLRLIKHSGPFPYKRDGIVFGNYERKLPRQHRGYYTEYTVRTPGAKNRGARRIIAGKGRTGDPATSGEYYYTADHYRSFSRIREESRR